MSITFEAMILPAFAEREAIEALNKALYIADTERHQQFNAVHMGTAGGSKFFTSDVYAACFNHFIPDDVEDYVRNAPWRHPDHVLYLVHMGDDDYGFVPRTIARLRAAASSRKGPR